MLVISWILLDNIVEYEKLFIEVVLLLNFVFDVVIDGGDFDMV